MFDAVIAVSVPGIIGCYQALEAIKIAANIGSILSEIRCVHIVMHMLCFLSHSLLVGPSVCPSVLAPLSLFSS